MDNIGTVQEITPRKIFKVTIPLTYEVVINTRDEVNKLRIEEIGIEALARDRATRMFLAETSVSLKKHVICETIRDRADVLWRNDAIGVEEV